MIEVEVVYGKDSIAIKSVNSTLKDSNGNKWQPKINLSYRNILKALVALRNINARVVKISYSMEDLYNV